MLPRVDQDTGGQSSAWVSFTEQLSGGDGNPKFKSSGSPLAMKTRNGEREGKKYLKLWHESSYPKLKVRAGILDSNLTNC